VADAPLIVKIEKEDREWAESMADPRAGSKVLFCPDHRVVSVVMKVEVCH